MILQPNMKVLFQGDSVTDFGRDYNDEANLGYGYPLFIKKALNRTDVQLINKAVSGERISDVYKRRERDIFKINPDIFSFLIGVNDTWRRYDSNKPRTAEEFEEIYRTLLDEIKKRLPKTKIVLMSPFILEVPDKKAWLTEDLQYKQAAVDRVAEDYADVYIPLHKLFKEDFDRHEDIYYLSPDGVHPNEAGHTLIANAWIEALTK